MSEAAEVERDVLLCGSVGLSSKEEVMRSAAEMLDGSLARISDGEMFESGEQRPYTLWQRFHVEENPAFEVDPDEAAHGGRITKGPETARVRLPPRFRVKPGVANSDITFGPTRHAEQAIHAYGIFRRLKSEGVIAPATRFQMTLLTTAAFLNTTVVARDHARVETRFRQALFDEVARAAEVIPADELTVQWDVSTEMAQLEGVRDAWWSTDPDEVRAGVVERLSLHCNAVPEPIELGLHLCYGNAGFRHWKEPDDTFNMVDLFNRTQHTVRRRIDYVHMPVPITRDDDAYFAPLEKLELRDGAHLYLGLVHIEDGVAGARRRMAAASRHFGPYGISTECGLGSRTPEQVREIFRLYAEVAHAS